MMNRKRKLSSEMDSGEGFNESDLTDHSSSMKSSRTNIDKNEASTSIGDTDLKEEVLIAPCPSPVAPMTSKDDAAVRDSEDSALSGQKENCLYLKIQSDSRKMKIMDFPSENLKNAELKDDTKMVDDVTEDEDVKFLQLKMARDFFSQRMATALKVKIEKMEDNVKKVDSSTNQSKIKEAVEDSTTKPVEAYITELTDSTSPVKESEGNGVSEQEEPLCVAQKDKDLSPETAKAADKDLEFKEPIEKIKIDLEYKESSEMNEAEENENQEFSQLTQVEKYQDETPSQGESEPPADLLIEVNFTEKRDELLLMETSSRDSKESCEELCLREKTKELREKHDRLSSLEMEDIEFRKSSDQLLDYVDEDNEVSKELTELLTIDESEDKEIYLASISSDLKQYEKKKEENQALKSQLESLQQNKAKQERDEELSYSNLEKEMNELRIKIVNMEKENQQLKQQQQQLVKDAADNNESLNMTEALRLHISVLPGNVCNSTREIGISEMNRNQSLDELIQRCETGKIKATEEGRSSMSLSTSSRSRPESMEALPSTALQTYDCTVMNQLQESDVTVLRRTLEELEADFKEAQKRNGELEEKMSRYKTCYVTLKKACQKKTEKVSELKEVNKNLTTQIKTLLEENKNLDNDRTRRDKDTIYLKCDFRDLKREHEKLKQKFENVKVEKSALHDDSS